MQMEMTVPKLISWSEINCILKFSLEGREVPNSRIWVKWLNRKIKDGEKGHCRQLQYPRAFVGVGEKKRKSYSIN